MSDDDMIQRRIPPSPEDDGEYYTAERLAKHDSYCIR